MNEIFQNQSLTLLLRPLSPVVVRYPTNLYLARSRPSRRHPIPIRRPFQIQLNPTVVPHKNNPTLKKKHFLFCPSIPALHRGGGIVQGEEEKEEEKLN